MFSVGESTFTEQASHKHSSRICSRICFRPWTCSSWQIQAAHHVSATRGRGVPGNSIPRSELIFNFTPVPFFFNSINFVQIESYLLILPLCAKSCITRWEHRDERNFPCSKSSQLRNNYHYLRQTCDVSIV